MIFLSIFLHCLFFRIPGALFAYLLIFLLVVVGLVGFHLILCVGRGEGGRKRQEECWWERCVGATRGVTVSMSAFLACHQCYCAGSSLAWGLNLGAAVCGIF